MGRGPRGSPGQWYLRRSRGARAGAQRSGRVPHPFTTGYGQRGSNLPRGPRGRHHARRRLPPASTKGQAFRRRNLSLPPQRPRGPRQAPASPRRPLRAHPRHCGSLYSMPGMSPSRPFREVVRRHGAFLLDDAHSGIGETVGASRKRSASKTRSISSPAPFPRASAASAASLQADAQPDSRLHDTASSTPRSSPLPAPP